MEQKLDFRELADLRLFLRELRERHVDTLSLYYESQFGGFSHKYQAEKPNELSKSSTATCVLSLVTTNQWKKPHRWANTTSTLVQRLLTEEWTSAALEKNNLFTVSWVLEAVTELMRIDSSVSLTGKPLARLGQAAAILTKAVKKGPEALKVKDYPASAYIAQLVVRTLKKRDAFVDKRRRIAKWAEGEINRQIALLSHDDKTADVFQLAYSTILLTTLLEQPGKITPDEEFIIEAALKTLFEHQRSDGTWPLSRPLFHYPKLGSAYCYDYEMLVQLLSEPRLEEKLLRFIPHLRKSALALKSYFPLGGKQEPQGRGWSSGHHPQLKGPESWSTASVYHFAHVFERLLAEQIRQETFAFLGRQYSAPEIRASYQSALGPDFLDCELELDGSNESLKNVVSKSIIGPLIKDLTAGRVESGEELSKETPVSMIFYGPPGTSKSDLAKRIAQTLGWPLLTVDSSQFLKEGMDGVYREADSIFGMLAIAERMVVLLDEFDEMVRARETAPEVLSRFLTTAMLPKLHKIHDNRRLVFIVATNHIDWFDVAIRRPGRFDVILQVMPPTVPEKQRTWSELSPSAVEMTDAELSTKLKPLTFLEARALAEKIKDAGTAAQKRQLIEKHYETCTLRSEVPTAEGSTGDAKTWEGVCSDQKELSRVL